MKKLLYIALAAVIATGCSKENIENESSKGGEVTLRATMQEDAAESWSGKAASRASGGTWTVNDRIGVFVYNGAQAIATNAQYKIDNAMSGAMSAVASTDNIHHPAGGSIDYYAYYPYNSALSGTTYKVDVTDQSDLTKIDLMWAKTVAQTTKNVALAFSHSLTKLVFNIEAGGREVADLSDMTATLVGANAKADFDLKSGAFANAKIADIALKVTAGATPDKATITAIVAPTTTLTACKVIFTAGGKSFSWTPATAEWTGSKSYDYNITIGAK